MPWLTTYQNVAFGPKLRGDLRGEALDREIGRLLDKVGLADFKDKYPLQLSGGMQRRAELARAMINSPSIMIMDEPFRGLDAMTRELMQEFLLRLFEETGRTHFFVTSEIEEAIFLADQLVVLSNRPVTVRTVIDIALPRPREFHMLSTSEAYEYKREALEILHEEAMKSFGGGGAQSELVEAIAPPRLTASPCGTPPSDPAAVNRWGRQARPPGGSHDPGMARAARATSEHHRPRGCRRGPRDSRDGRGGEPAPHRAARGAVAAALRIRRDVDERRAVHRRGVSSGIRGISCRAMRVVALTTAESPRRASHARHPLPGSHRVESATAMTSAGSAGKSAAHAGGGRVRSIGAPRRAAGSR